jgi:hypothetical protein
MFPDGWGELLKPIIIVDFEQQYVKTFIDKNLAAMPIPL